jgi:hypothetical protein
LHAGRFGAGAELRSPIELDEQIAEQLAFEDFGEPRRSSCGVVAL